MAFSRILTLCSVFSLLLYTVYGGAIVPSICDNPPDGVVCGCTDVTATNFDSQATDDDGSCVHIQAGDASQAVVIMNFGSTHTWTDRTYSPTGPAELDGLPYVRGQVDPPNSPCSGISGAFDQGGASFRVSEPVELFVACAHHCGTTEASRPMPIDGRVWTEVDSSHYTMISHSGTPLHYYTVEIDDSYDFGTDILVCCDGCWTTGTLIRAL